MQNKMTNSDKILCSWNIREYLAALGILLEQPLSVEKNRVPKVSEKKTKHLELSVKKTKHPKTKWTGY